MQSGALARYGVASEQVTKCVRLHIAGRAHFERGMVSLRRMRWTWKQRGICTSSNSSNWLLLAQS
jgi:hypothetical protein